MKRLLAATLPLAPLTALLLAPLAMLQAAPTGPARESDVVVYGSTPGGFCAAIAAAREGAVAILPGPAPHVHGLKTGGLSR